MEIEIEIYKTRIGRKVVLLLCGGMKSSQKKGFEKAQKLLKDFKDRED